MLSTDDSPFLPAAVISWIGFRSDVSDYAALYADERRGLLTVFVPIFRLCVVNATTIAPVETTGSTIC